MQIHDQGEKARRDRAKIMAKYDELTKFAGLNRLKAEALSKLSNTEFYRLCEDTYNALPRRVKVAYAESIGAVPRRNPAAFKWFYRDLIALKQAEGLLWLWYTLASPFKYRGFLERRKKRAAYEATAMKLYPGMTAAEAVAALDKQKTIDDKRAKSNKAEPDQTRDPVNPKPAPALKLEK